VTIQKTKGIAVLAEVVAVLARYPGLRVAPVVDREDGVVSLTISVNADGVDGLTVLALHDELKFVADIATVRAIAACYNIDKARLDDVVIPAMHDDAPPHAVRHLTVAEVEAVVAVLTEQTGPADPPTPTDRLLDTATVKLVELGRALAGAV
jgi:hypothetical protein